MTITEFLEARIAEDEAAANAYAKVPPLQVFNGSTWVGGYDPARVLAECAAKRAIIKLAEDVESMDTQISNEWGGPNDGTADEILAALAAVYADHPDYQDEWAA